MKTRVLLALTALAAAFQLPAQAAGPDPVARGRYLAQVAGCNDCHTPGYPQSDGHVPEKGWLVGSEVGFSGPWGVSYASNLRLLAQKMSAAEWRVHARTPRRPPMPWFALRDMSDADVDAIYAFLRHLGPAGVPAPAAVAPGQPIPTAHIPFVPQPPTGVLPVSASIKE
jgi:mono/diheme cytochrome c family protein